METYTARASILRGPLRGHLRMTLAFVSNSFEQPIGSLRHSSLRSGLLRRLIYFSGGATVPDEQLRHMVSTYQEISQLWLIYSAGVIAVYALFALLYHYAYTKRQALELNEYETLCTRSAIIHFCGYAVIATLVAIAALILPAPYVSYSGFLFFLNGVWGWTAGAALGKRQRQALERMQASQGAEIAASN